MNARELIVRAEGLCRALRQPFPAEVKAYAWDWQRERYHLGWCWNKVKSALKERRALWMVEAEVRRHHALLQAEQDRKQRDLCKPVLASPTHSTTPQRDCLQLSAALPALDPDDIEDGFWPAPRHETEVTMPPPQTVSPTSLARRTRSETSRGRPEPAREGLPVGVTGRPNSKANKVRALLEAHVLRRGPISVWKLESIARSEGLLRHDQPVGRCSTFRRIAEDLGIESYRIGFGRGASYVWRLKPPEWTRSSDQPN